MKKLLTWGGMWLTLCCLPLYVSALQMPFDLEQAHKKHERYNFTLLAKEGEIKPGKDKQCTLVLKGVKKVVYQGIAPARDAGTLRLKEFTAYWQKGATFSVSPPNAGLVATEKKGGNLDSYKSYVFTLNNADEKGRDTLVFDCTLTNVPVTQDTTIWDVVMIVDDYSGGGGI